MQRGPLHFVMLSRQLVMRQRPAGAGRLRGRLQKRATAIPRPIKSHQAAGSSRREPPTVQAQPDGDRPVWLSSTLLFGAAPPADAELVLPTPVKEGIPPAPP